MYPEAGRPLERDRACTARMRPSYARAIPRPWRRTARIFIALGEPHRQRILLMFERDERLTSARSSRRRRSRAPPSRITCGCCARPACCARRRSAAKSGTAATPARCARRWPDVLAFLDRCLAPGSAMHEPNQFDLLRQRRFAPFFWTQFLGAGNDNVFKNALVIFVAFQPRAGRTSIAEHAREPRRRAVHPAVRPASRRRPGSSPTSSRSRASSATSRSSRSRSWWSAPSGSGCSNLSLLLRRAVR